jgi:hypothetical protein
MAALNSKVIFQTRESLDGRSFLGLSSCNRLKIFGADGQQRLLGITVA